jgi:hypothetical protein
MRFLESDVETRCRRVLELLVETGDHGLTHSEVIDRLLADEAVPRESPMATKLASAVRRAMGLLRGAGYLRRRKRVMQ